MPGAIGGIDWGGVSIDPDLNYAFTDVTNMPTMVQLSANSKRATPGNNGWAFTSGYVRFHDADGRPCISGRQGEMVAINLNTGKVAWRVPLGDLTDEYGPRARAGRYRDWPIHRHPRRGGVHRRRDRWKIPRL